jgi:hypothetical protein
MSLSPRLFSRRFCSALLVAILLLWVVPPVETQKTKLRRVGWISTQTEALAFKNLELTRAAFAELGWRDGENLTLDMVYAEGRTDRGAELANQLLQRAPRCLLLVATSSPPVLCKSRKPFQSLD